MSEFIVAEVSKNFGAGDPFAGGILSKRFEKIIEVNRKRGYRLHSWKLDRIQQHDGIINETIIAVFQKHEDKV